MTQQKAFQNLIAFVIAAASIVSVNLLGEEQSNKEPLPAIRSKTTSEEFIAKPGKMEVDDIARDGEISNRIESILSATGWFSEPKVRSENGVVFLNGQTDNIELKKWAGSLAQNTQDVVAVVNHIEVSGRSFWDLQPAWDGLIILWRDILSWLPFLLFAILILLFSVGASYLAARGASRFTQSRIRSKFLRSVVTKATGVFVLLLGIYIILRVSGLSQLAMTMLGGTGLIGLIVGIAFKNITENFLASILLSIQRPFENGDLVKVCGETGYVQQLNMRATVLMTFSGNLVQIPNAAIYQNNLLNYTTNVNRREDFVVGIGYDDSINQAQEVAIKVLRDHPAVLKDPEPSVLADSLGQATVNLRVYFWINGREHSWLKVRSSVIRLIKLAFQDHGISMPDEAREIIFPKGIPVSMINPPATVSRNSHTDNPIAVMEKDIKSSEASTLAEGGLTSEAEVLENQARQSNNLKDMENLLENSHKQD